MKFKFNPKKSAQAAHLLLRLSGENRKLNYMVLVKLLYLSDRAALMALEAPITGDRLAALPYGPVVGHVLNLIRLGPANEEDAPWFDAVSPPTGYDVVALDDPGDDELSNAEETILRQVWEEYGTKDWKELSRLTHRLPEWVDPNGSSVPIAPEQILMLAGKSMQDIDRIRDEQAVFRRLDEDIAAYAVAEPASVW